MSKRLVAAIVVLACSTTVTHARSVRVDSGDWDVSGFTSGSSTESIGFDFSMLGVTANTAQINSDGSVELSGGGESVLLNPFFEPGQAGGGNTSQYQFAVTNTTFSAPGVEAGFRVSWLVQDSGGALLNEFQMSLFELTGGQYALEYNYNGITFGDDGSQIGYSTSLGDSFDLLAELGLGFDEYMGFGDDGFGNNCDNGGAGTLACNNYYDGVFGAAPSILPDTAGGFFQFVDSNSTDPDAQGRYLWIFGAPPTGAPEPTTLALFTLGLIGFLRVQRRK